MKLVNIVCDREGMIKTLLERRELWLEKNIDGIGIDPFIYKLYKTIEENGDYKNKRYVKNLVNNILSVIKNEDFDMDKHMENVSIVKGVLILMDRYTFGIIDGKNKAITPTYDTFGISYLNKEFRIATIEEITDYVNDLNDKDFQIMAKTLVRF